MIYFSISPIHAASLSYYLPEKGETNKDWEVELEKLWWERGTSLLWDSSILFFFRRSSISSTIKNASSITLSSFRILLIKMVQSLGFFASSIAQFFTSWSSSTHVFKTYLSFTHWSNAVKTLGWITVEELLVRGNGKLSSCVETFSRSIVF